MGWAAWVPLISVWPWWGHSCSCKTHRQSSSHSSLYTLCASLPRLRGPGGKFQSIPAFPSQSSMNSKAIQRNLYHLLRQCNQGFDYLDFWVNTTAYVPLFGHCCFTRMVLANIEPYIRLQCRTVRNQAESSFFSLDLLYSFLLTHLPLLACSHSLSSNHIWSLFFSTVSCLISFHKNMCTLTL